jgi:hypothetical protein
VVRDHLAPVAATTPHCRRCGRGARGC